MEYFEKENVSIETLKKREQEILNLIAEIKDIYLGMWFCLDDVLVVNRKPNIDRIEALTEKLVLCTQCDGNCKSFYSEFYRTVIFYLYAECNIEDRIFLSFLKIADTIYKDDDGVSFSQTTFGIMLADAEAHCREGNESVEYQELMLCKETLENLYNEAEMLTDVYFTVKNAVNKFVHEEGFSCLKNQKIFKKALSSLRTAKIDALYGMDQAYRWGSK